MIAFPGSHQQLPKYSPSCVTRAAKSECAPYLELATAYSKSDEAVSKVITQHAQTFQEVRQLLHISWTPRMQADTHDAALQARLSSLTVPMCTCLSTPVHKAWT